MKILIKSACIITCDSGKVVKDGFILIFDGKIELVGNMPVPQNVKSEPNMHVIDAGGRIVMPGLVNPHMHLYSQFARGLNVPRMRSFLEILDGLWWRLDRALTLEAVHYSALLGFIEAIKAGVTTVIDHHASYGCTKGSLDMLSQASAETGLRSALCYEVSDRNGEKERDLAIEENLAVSKNELVRNMFGLHASLTLSGATLKKVRRANEKLKMGYHIHVAEGPEDLEDSKSQYGKSVVARLYDEGILTPGTIAAHCIHVNDNDLALLKGSGAFVVHNPISNMNNAVGTAPYLRMCANGIPVGIGTDGMSAGIMDDVKAASVMHKEAAADPQAGWNEVRNSTLKVNSQIASALFGTELGAVRKGAGADVIIVDSIPFTEVNEGNFWAHILFGAANSRVHTTICAGRVLMEGYLLAAIDEASIITEARKISGRMWGKLSILA